MTSTYAHPVKGILAVRRIRLGELAVAIGYNPTHLSLVLNGYRPMSPEMAERLSVYLDVPVEATATESLVERQVRELVASAPPLTAEALSRLAALLRPTSTVPTSVEAA